MGWTSSARLLGIRPGDALFPESLREAVIGEDLVAQSGILDLDPSYALARPVEKELSRGLADALLRIPDFHIEGRCRGEPERLCVFGDGADEEPAALLETDRAERARFEDIVERDTPLNLAVLDDLDDANRVLGRELGLEFELDRCASGRLEHVARQLASCRDAEERAIGHERPAASQAVLPAVVSQTTIQVNINAIVTDR